MIKRLSQNTHWIAISLFAITLVTRLPFASQYLYHGDSVNMAFGLRHFDVQAGAPQYPGYIVYIWLGQLVNAFVHNEQTTLVFISIVSSGLSAPAIYYLGREMFQPATGIVAAVFLIASPLVWFYGEIALPHTLDLFAITLALWLLYRIMQGKLRPLWFTAVFLALLGGIRQQDLLFLGPVVLFALWGVGINRIIFFGVMGAAVALVWFLPLIQNTGGLQAYMAGSSGYSNTFFSTTSLLHGAGIPGLRRNILSKLIPYALYAWSLAVLPAIIYWGTQVPRCWRTWLKNRKAWFVVLSISPSLAFYAFIHMGQQGLVFVFMPTLFVLSAEGLRRLLSHTTQLKLGTTAIALVGAGIFLLAPVRPLGVRGPKLLTLDTIRERDTTIQHQINSVRINFAPDSTVLLAMSWRFMEYYLPEYPLARVDMGARWETDEGELAGVDFERVTAESFNLQPNAQWQVAILDAALLTLIDAPVATLATENGSSTDYLTLNANEAFVFDNGEFHVEEPV